jgi:hypothetical protein
MIKNIYRFLNPKHQKLFLEYKVDFKPRYGHGKPAHPELFKIIESGREKYREIISRILPLKEKIWEIKDSKNETSIPEPLWNNGYLPGLDIVSLYSVISIFKPSKYIEIGSGNSTKVAFKAKRDCCPDMEIISIDPLPRTDIEGLINNMINEPLEKTSLYLPDLLSENDILSIDGSHRLFPNSDSMVFFLEVLPNLRKGVIVHIHDIYLPYDYPQFMCDRYYSEQYCLAIYLLANPKRFEIMIPNYFISQDNELSELISPVWNHKNLENAERHGGSFWMRIAE